MRALCRIAENSRKEVRQLSSKAGAELDKPEIHIDKYVEDDSAPCMIKPLSCRMHATFKKNFRITWA